MLDVTGSKILVISKYALDYQKYNNTYEDITWEKSSIRTWLNGDFYNEAFNDYHQKMIENLTVNADKNPDYNTQPGNNTEDKVFLLSINQVNNYFSSDYERKSVPTQYAIAQGAKPSEEFKLDGKATCDWWLRSPGYGAYDACYVRNSGSVNSVGVYVNNYYGVRPALWINLES